MYNPFSSPIFSEVLVTIIIYNNIDLNILIVE